MFLDELLIDYWLNRKFIFNALKFIIRHLLELSIAKIEFNLFVKKLQIC